MPPSLELQIRQAVTEYIAGRASLREFQEWFAPRTWDIGSMAQTGELPRLANEIDLLLAEFSNGHWTEQELKNKLQEYSRVVQPLKDLAGVLWSEVRAPYVYGVTSRASGYQETMRFGEDSPPIPSRQIDPSPVPS